MRHLVTGGSGFLGNLIARTLHERGEETIVFDLWEDRTRPPQIRFIKGDVRDPSAVRAAMEGVDIVHHTAALVPLTKSGRKFWDVNAEGSRIVAEEARRAGVKVFVHVSSSAVYGIPRESPITEHTPPRPMEPYGRSKLEGEKRVQLALKNSVTRLLIIRPRTILAKGRLGIFQLLFQWIKMGDPIFLIGSGKVRFQLIHATDLIDAYTLLLSRQAEGIYNIGALQYGTLKKDLEDIVSYAQSKSKIVTLPVTPSIFFLKVLDLLGLSPFAPWHYRTLHKDFHFEVGPLLQLGWRPHYSNADMLKEAYDDFLKMSPDEMLADRSPHRRAIKEAMTPMIRFLGKWVRRV